MANWCRGCEAGSKGGWEDGTKEIKLSKTCCHSNH